MNSVAAEIGAGGVVTLTGISIRVKSSVSVTGLAALAEAGTSLDESGPSGVSKAGST